jgi:hypothetical protein
MCIIIIVFILNYGRKNNFFMAKETHYVTEELLREALIKIQDTNDKEAKEQAGEMILKIVQKLSTKTNFGGYTYKEDFQIRAIEHILLYGVKNFDRNLISPITGKQTKAFSYITDIARRAFIAVINDMKEEEKELRDNIIPIEELAMGMPRTRYNEIKDVPKDTHEIYIELAYNNGELSDAENSYLSLYDVVKPFEGKKLKVLYPDTYNMSFEEYDKICELKFDYLNINKHQTEKYKPSFPKKGKKKKEDLSEEWV